MTTNWHTPFSGGDNDLTTANLNSRLSNLDAGISGALILQVTLGENVAARQAGYISDSDLQGYVLDTSSTTPKAGMIRGFWMESASSGGTGKLQVGGVMGGFSGLTAFGRLYVSSTAGALTQTQLLPSLAGAQILRAEMGVAISATEIYIRPKPLAYEKRDAMALNDEIEITHHLDSAAIGRKTYAFGSGGGGYRTTQIAVGWWASAVDEIVNLYGASGGGSIETKTTFKCLRAAGFTDVTCIVELP